MHLIYRLLGWLLAGYAVINSLRRPRRPQIGHDARLDGLDEILSPEEARVRLAAMVAGREPFAALWVKVSRRELDDLGYALLP